ncbi:hypothetical protein OSB04_001574 [Centaurea solstitialis]|uniref:Uncharacterized protein n=1 Tax=Centaurea solstitialis TaxID=347529 RepID=A0AA38TYS0_9ASTR|nr:hypothetical protein OSB04_001574 [Centaurea solstitialis]
MAPYPPCISSCNYDSRKSWPELLGVPEAIACETIEKSNPNIKAIPILPGQIVSQDFCCNRVWVLVDKHGGVVIKIPIVG